MGKNNPNQLVTTLYKRSLRGRYSPWLKKTSKKPKNQEFRIEKARIIKKIQFIFKENDHMEQFFIKNLDDKIMSQEFAVVSGLLIQQS